MKRAFALVVALAGVLALPATSLAHLERTAYWPDPEPDATVTPAAGGAVPKVRTLASALDRKRPGDTRVVCQPNSLKLLTASVGAARSRGYELRPTQPKIKVSKRVGKRLISLNKQLFKRCRFHEIQPAVTASKNNDRVVVMPGLYTEPTSRAVAALPPECDRYRVTSEKGKGAVSYEYQYHCPNAQSLVSVIGRALGPGQDPPTTPTSRPDPHGIPNEGRCIRCNLQIEGSGPGPDDVVLDAGRVESGNKGPIEPKKDVTLKADRADGFVVRNMTLRHAAEHDIYILETDGYVQDRVKLYYAGEYGTLMFASDHGLTQDCDAVGSGDSGIYPGGAPDTGVERNPRFYDGQRYNQLIQRCDIHHNNMGTSGTMGNSVRYVDNDVYDNGAGFVTDSFYAGGHPGFPQDSTLYERNRVHDNNFDVYGPGSDVKSKVSIPVGTGMMIAGGNDNIVRNNHIYGNWRRGTMLLAVPDAISCAPSPSSGSPPCTPKNVSSTSNANLYYDNVMGVAPDGTKSPNGVDFWWDEFPGNAGNCWFPNTGVEGTTASVTSDPPPPPIAGTSIPKFMPQDCTSGTTASAGVGTGNAVKEAMLLDCAENGNDGICEWYKAPAKPGSAAASRQKAETDAAALRMVGMRFGGEFCTLIGDDEGTLTCPRYLSRLS